MPQLEHQEGPDLNRPGGVPPGKERHDHLVVQGRVKVTIPLDDGTQTVVDIFTTDDFFGESSLLGASQYSERALALDNVTLMSWTSGEIEEQVERQPRLGIALLQMLVKRGLDYEERLQSFALQPFWPKGCKAKLCNPLAAGT